jgi:hypothetical protein
MRVVAPTSGEAVVRPTDRGKHPIAVRFRRYGVVTGVAASLAVLALDTVLASIPVLPRWVAPAAGGAVAIVWLGVGVLGLVDRAAIPAGTRASQLTAGYIRAAAVAAVAAASGAAIAATGRVPHTIAALTSIIAAAISTVAAGYAAHRSTMIRTDLAAAIYLRHLNPPAAAPAAPHTPAPSGVAEPTPQPGEITTDPLPGEAT